MKKETLTIKCDGRATAGGIGIGWSSNHRDHKVDYSGYKAKRFLENPIPEDTLRLVPSLDGHLKSITLDLHDIGLKIPKATLEKVSNVFQEYAKTHHIDFIFIAPNSV